MKANNEKDLTKLSEKKDIAQDKKVAAVNKKYDKEIESLKNEVAVSQCSLLYPCLNIIAQT